jgi:hypothetical protein
MVAFSRLLRLFASLVTRYHLLATISSIVTPESRSA